MLPSALGSLAKLQTLDLSHNQINGPVPPSFSGLVALTWLDFSNNQLTGAVPAAFGSLPELIHLDLSFNGLIGGIPAPLGNLSKLVFLDLSDNGLNGAIPPDLGSLATLQTLNLGHNQLNGFIPTQIGNLSELTWLNLGDNTLSNSIPTEIGNLSKLEGLYLDCNLLSGEIPASLTALTQLGSTPGNQLSLDYNLLTASDAALVTFLDAQDPTWSATQTVAPGNFQALYDAPEIQLTWTPILYTGDGGYYEISVSEDGGAFIVLENTTNKLSNSYVIHNWEIGVAYQYRLRTYTPAHDNQQSDLWSEYSDVVTITIQPLFLPMLGYQTQE
jgi:hypothetical protein